MFDLACFFLPSFFASLTMYVSIYHFYALIPQIHTQLLTRVPPLCIAAMALMKKDPSGFWASAAALAVVSVKSVKAADTWLRIWAADVL